MNLAGNTIFIMGAGSGIGRGFAETLHGKGNKVIISGRRKSALEEVGRANPGIEFVELDIENPKSIYIRRQFVGEAASGTQCTDQQRKHHESG